jgi:hypothetical protein
MNLPIVQKIEICFWDVVIRLLSQSEPVRKFVQQATRLAQRKEFLSSLALITSGGLAGLLLGIIVPLVLQAVR